MASDYAAVRADNERKYGTDIGRIGPMLLANRYDDQSHFIFELLQNAEDALARRDGWDGPRKVEFKLSAEALHVSHFGGPFTEADVRGICGIAESTKDLTSIGRFGIGFKSVYALTDWPEIHSGDEHFAIESFVWPRSIPAIDMRPGETVFRLPLRQNGSSAVTEIESGLRRLGPRTLLFLREIEEVSWSVAGGPSGLYLRDKPDSVGKNARRVAVIGEDHVTDGVTEENWLVFSREVCTANGVKVGHVELAFALENSEGGGELSVRAVTDSPLVVFFPTIIPTHLGFVVQGPYRTTPSRDNVPTYDPWNRHLVDETALLLIDALRQLCSLGLLTVAAFRSLPLAAFRFREGTMFAPLFTAVREALLTEPLLPRFGGGHIAAPQARLARTQDLRELLSPPQLTNLFQADEELAWVSGDITQERTPEIRRYLMHELKIAEIVPETLVARLTKPFLEAQPDKWIVRVYEFLRGQPALLRGPRLNDIPIVRLEDGTHVPRRKDGQVQAFLPGPISTGFPTVRKTVCETEDALAFLKDIGLTEPDLIDDIIVNVLPRYQGDDVQVGDDEYKADIDRLLAAFSIDSTAQRIKLRQRLRDARFVAAMDAGDGSRRFAQPTDVYQATQRLKDLFRGVSGVLIVDDTLDCLRGERIRDLLEACGAALYLLPIEIEPSFTRQQLAEMRRKAGSEDMTYEICLQDFTLRGLDALLATIGRIPLDQAHARATLLWEALCDVEDRRGTSAFSGIYTWKYIKKRGCIFDAALARLLNETAWVPDSGDKLERPEFVLFDDIEPPWYPNPFLLSKIRFKPPIIKELAKEAGIEPELLDLLKKLGLTSEAELRDRLGIGAEAQEPNGDTTPNGLSTEDALRRFPGDQHEPTPPVGDPTEAPDVPRTDGGGSSTLTTAPNAQPGGGEPIVIDSSRGKLGNQRAAGKRMFISYVAVHVGDEESDADDRDHQQRMALEGKAIELVMSGELGLQRTPTNNPGFDLVQKGAEGNPIKWVEVKAMKGSLGDRPVGLSRRQFEFAQARGEAYWLYIVERASSPEQARILRIQDPAGKARTFTFDQGWLNVADVDTDQDNREA